jgi:uncharacterized repeat protein (TIGR01451 family)
MIVAAEGRLRLLLGAVAALVLAAGIFGVAPGSAAAAGSGYFVTFVARSCPSYSDIFANKARNNIQESLVDLGPDSPYNSDPGSLVDPSVEGRSPQDACTPLPNWKFTLGHNFQAGASIGPWGSLSAITDPFEGSIVTKVSTPLFDQYHQRIGHQGIAGATTVELTDDELKQASGGGLWAQGGVPDDPVLAQEFPGPKYGFGALRCAADALNGDNVETVYFPAGVTHVFCYALYVVPPPTSGTITIEKKVVGAPSGENPSFAFNGSISFDPNGFTLANGQSQDFFRAGGQDWAVTESPVDSYKLSSVVCTAQTASGGAGSSTSTVTGSTATIHLVANEHVTCVYTNTYVPPVGGLSIDKITRDGVGRFGYTVAPSGGGARHQETATTHHAGVPAVATPSLTDLSPGSYTITEHPPSSRLGRWKTVRVTCDGAKETPGKPVHVTVTSGQTTTCAFVNLFIPAGAISLAKVTDGSTGSVNFLIGGHAGLQVTQYHQRATTTRQGVPAGAHPDTAADSTAHLPLGLYVIAEQATFGENPRNWNVDSVKCNGQVVPFDRGVIIVTLTPAHPRLHCVYTDRFHSHPTPPPPPPPPPPTPPGPPPPNPPVPAYASADLSVTKQALSTVVVKGDAVTYRVTVHNNGPDAASHVVVADQPRGNVKIVYVHPSTGQCHVGKLIVCRLGNLNAGDTASIRVRLIPETNDKTFDNRVAVGSATGDPKRANNLSKATVKIIVPPKHPVACGSRLDPVAHAAC